MEYPCIKTTALAIYCIPGALFMNKLKLSQLSLCVRFKAQNSLNSVREIGSRGSGGVQIVKSDTAHINHAQDTWPHTASIGI